MIRIDPFRPVTLYFLLALRSVTTATASSKYFVTGRSKFGWRLDVPTRVIRNLSTASFRAESPNFTMINGDVPVVRKTISITPTSGLYYKLMTIVNDDSRVVNKLEASLTEDARVIIYDHHMFIVQATAQRYTAWWYEQYEINWDTQYEQMCYVGCHIFIVMLSWKCCFLLLLWLMLKKTMSVFTNW